ncbi:MAG: AMP-binding protein [Stomatobaculum sp.]|nr:AMP-binding protein [Stomatobaculum sp.]
MADTVLLTGATGFLGTELATRLIREPGLRLYALVRAADEAGAAHRLRSAWHYDGDLCGQIGKRVVPVPGDFTEPGLGLGEKYRKILSDAVTLVIHSGAQISFKKSWEEFKNVNTDGTEKMLTFASGLRMLRRFVQVSTAYVAGQKRGIVMEEEPHASAFSTFYEKSKAEAEDLVRASGLPFSICRPGMIVGDSRNGRVRTFNTIYYVLKQMLLGKMRVFPISPDTKLNLVPVDYVADAVEKVCFSAEAAGKTFHLTCPISAAPGAGELAEYVRNWAKKNLALNLPKAVFLPMPALKKAGLLHNQNKAEGKSGYLNNLLTLLPYFFAEQVFDRTNTDQICGPYPLSWKDYLGPLMDYACRKNFMRQTGQTVFEQARVRRESRRFPVNYYDVTAKKIQKVSGPEANKRIDRILDALWALGVRKGDRIALTGVNSVDYMALEQAMGLMGAVSVPIYYTTPAEETSLLLEKCGAKWFFVGDRRMMKQLGKVKTDAKIVTFSAAEAFRGELAGEKAAKKAAQNVMSWDDFLAADAGPVKVEPPEPEDLATIRYTSGTTGEPKGVMFRFGQLSWVGDALAGMLSWKERNRPIRYLSFLPLNHVVEGILTANAPYYLLTKIDFYYLNDFNALSEALPKVRPTLFFSVPRFYEKIWEQVVSNGLGKAWLAAEDGPRKRALGAVLRKAVLKKAGLDCCGQLIVGSAPISEALLRNFRSLGIEVFNAYGETEAPLITINRQGDNVIPTVGTPLPETVITAEPDGELIVKGPQVAAGYYGMPSENLRDGVLRTGDLGVIHENGHITLLGRKKELIVTAYGKNISIPKIEERLKDLPGITEAVLIGENRPYCTALLWASGDTTGLEKKIAHLNTGLSHPEQIRKFRVISRPLSIETGELTPNLKVKRSVVEEHYAKEIREMYR